MSRLNNKLFYSGKYWEQIVRSETMLLSEKEQQSLEKLRTSLELTRREAGRIERATRDRYIRSQLGISRADQLLKDDQDFIREIDQIKSFSLSPNSIVVAPVIAISIASGVGLAGLNSLFYQSTTPLPGSANQLSQVPEAQVSPSTSPSPAATPEPSDSLPGLDFIPVAPESPALPFQHPSEVVSDRLKATGVQPAIFDKIFVAWQNKNWDQLSIEQQQQLPQNLLATLATNISAASLHKLGTYSSDGFNRTETWEKVMLQQFYPASHYYRARHYKRVRDERDSVFDETNRRFAQIFPDWSGKNLSGTGLDEVWAALGNDVLGERTQLARR